MKTVAIIIYWASFPMRIGFSIDTQEHPSYILIVKKHYWISLLAISILLVSCLDWVIKEPSIVLREINIKPRTLSSISIILDLDVQNPNPFDLTLSSFEYTVYLDKEKIGNGRSESVLFVPSSSTTRVQVPVTASFKDLGKNLKTIITDDNVPYKIEGKAVIKTFFQSLDWPFSKEGHVKK